MQKKMWAACLALTMIVAACGGSDSSGSSTPDESEESARLEGLSISVGSKDFTENILLAEILAQALESEGAEVDNKTNLGGTNVNRDALINGEIGVYPEYNGTAWAEHQGNKEAPVNDPEELTKLVAEADSEEGIIWSGRSPFNDTYGFAASPATAEEHGEFDFDSMAAYLKDNPDAVVCMEPEFPGRTDGLVLFEDATGYELPEAQQEILGDAGIIYTETQNENCNFGEIFTTDARISELGLSLVKDPGVMILYNLSFTYDAAIHADHAEVLDELSDTIFKDLDEIKMMELNGQVDIEGDDAASVATAYLEEIGLV